MKKKFKLTNVILYAKGWYLRTDNIWNDLIKILELDNYMPFDKADVYNIIIHAVQEFNLCRWTELREVLNGITDSNCWKYGYYTNTNSGWILESHKFPKYDMQTAFIYYVLSNLAFIDNEQWNVQMPKITKYPKGQTITIRNLFEHFILNKQNYEKKM